jgi:acyl-CoA oxidase
MPLTGVKAGDLGPKMGYNNVDNGWMMFDNFRIPRSAILSRFGDVTKEGKFVQKGDIRMLYNAMVQTRMTIIVGVAFDLRKALLISTRYAVCRR